VHKNVKRNAKKETKNMQKNTQKEAGDHRRLANLYVYSGAADAPVVFQRKCIGRDSESGRNCIGCSVEHNGRAYGDRNVKISRRGIERRLCAGHLNSIERKIKRSNSPIVAHSVIGAKRNIIGPGHRRRQRHAGYVRQRCRCSVYRSIGNGLK
jgi:hypothetical protein